MNNKEFHTRRESNVSSERQRRLTSATLNTLKQGKNFVDNQSTLSQCGSNIKFWEGTQLEPDNDTLEFLLQLRNVIMTQRQTLKKYKSKYRSKQQQLQKMKCLFLSQKGILREGDGYAMKDSAPFFNNESVQSTNKVEPAFIMLQYEALRVEAVTTLYELEFLKTEHMELKGILDSRNAELQSMADKLQSCQEEMATLELERELSRVDISHNYPTSQSVQCNVESKRPTQPFRLSLFSLACLRRQTRDQSDRHGGMGTEATVLPSEVAASQSDTVKTHIEF